MTDVLDLERQTSIVTEMLTDDRYVESGEIEDVAAFEDAMPDQPVVHVSPFCAGLASEVEELSLLGPNWDSYGAERISASAVAFALRLVDLTRPSVLPEMVGINDGGIELDWAAGERSLEVTISPNGVVTEVAVNGALIEADSLGQAAVNLIRTW